MQEGEEGETERHCRVDRDWDYSMYERSFGPAEVEEDT